VRKFAVHFIYQPKSQDKLHRKPSLKANRWNTAEHAVSKTIRVLIKKYWMSRGPRLILLLSKIQNAFMSSSMHDSVPILAEENTK